MKDSLVIAGGCFWCLDAVYRQVSGVHDVISGYTGGHTPNPFYEQVCAGGSGHAEAVEVVFDPQVISREQIMELFFASHDPTTLNRQGYDVGTQYRSALFYRSEEERAFFADQIRAAQLNWADPIVTTVEPLGEFHLAEPIHQDFYANNPYSGYCQVIINPKVAKVRQYYSSWLKT